MARNRLKAKGRNGKSRFTGIPHVVMDHLCYISLRHTSVRLLLDLARQYNGFNNGDLSAGWALMHKRGWKSRDTLANAIRELSEHGLILQTRQGGRNKCNLYALTWQSVDECRGKLDIRSTRLPPGDWQSWTPPADCHDRQSGEGSPAVGLSEADSP